MDSNDKFVRRGAYVTLWAMIALVIATTMTVVLQASINGHARYAEQQAACLARGGEIITFDGHEFCGVINVSAYSIE